jgi:hypothetical protein
MTRAVPGDRIIVRSDRIGSHDRDGEVLEARGPGGSPPFLVRWSDDGHVTLFFPGPDTVVHDGTGDDPTADTTARTPA